jgi:hypothetical protein
MAEGSMSLFEGIDVNPEKLAQAPPVVQRPSFISRTMGIGSRSSLEEAQMLMRQLSSKRFNEVNNNRRPVNPPPTIQEIRRQQESSFLSSILPSTGIMQGWFGGSFSSGQGSSSVSSSGRHAKYREGYIQPQDPSVLMDRRDLQPADSIEDSSLHDMEQGQSQGQGVTQGASQTATQGQNSPSEQRERNSVAVAPDPLTASYSGNENERDLSPVIPIYTTEVGFGQKEHDSTHDVVPNMVVSKYAKADVIVDDDGVELIQTVLPKPTSIATRTRLLGTSIASIVPIDSMESIDGILHNEDASVSKPSHESPNKPNTLSPGDLEETNGTNLANTNNSAKKFLQKQGTFANICIEEEEEWMLVGVAEPTNNQVDANAIPKLQFDAMNALRRNSNVLTQTTATTNDNSSRASSSRTTTIVRQFHHPMNATSAIDISGSEYGADNSEGSISGVVHLTGQFQSLNASSTENNDDLEYDRRQSQYLASSAGDSSVTLTSATLGLLGRRAPSTTPSSLNLLHGHGNTGAVMLDAVPEGPGDGSRSMLEEQSSLLSNDPRLRHLLVTQDIES